MLNIYFFGNKNGYVIDFTKMNICNIQQKYLKNEHSSIFIKILECSYL